jgi:hypothetical protein
VGRRAFLKTNLYCESGFLSTDSRDRTFSLNQLIPLKRVSVNPTQPKKFFYYRRLKKIKVAFKKGLKQEQHVSL